ncbi:hypothetical protein Ahy_B08g089103 [Arachis hypogaea]|uniref:Uncharacterized protein n=1 Tax=Arachis hypogaea TaxID=3818 RepID=A0A444XXK7_ARAHY|nr:hypothetical protein Ahy_B08g089103 [Arachis hypogaea]
MHFMWDAEHDLTIRKIFHHKIGRRLQQMLDDVRQERDHRTQWLRPDIKKALFVHWETDEKFRHRCLTNRANRALARSSKCTSGSTIFMKTKARLLKLLDREATLAETFKYTHTLKENKEILADQQSQDHYVRVLHTETKGHNSTVSARWRGYRRWICSCSRRSRCGWHETVSASNKNRIYKMRSFFASSLRTSTFKPSSGSATSRAIEPKKGVDLELGSDGGVPGPDAAGINPTGGSSPAGGNSPAGSSGPTVGGNSPAGGIGISPPSAPSTRAMGPTTTTT